MQVYLVKSDYFSEDEIKELFEKRGNWKSYTNENKADFAYLDGDFFFYKKHTNLQDIPSFIKNKFDSKRRSISDKNKLYHNLKKIDAHHIMMPQIIVNYDKLESYKPLFHPGVIFILKPVKGFAGRGIKIATNYNEFITYLKKGKREEFVMAQYITNPLLYNGLKFHIRALFMILHNNGKQSAYLFKQAYMITAMAPYKEAKYWDKSIHNTHIQENNIYKFPDEFTKSFGKEKTKIVTNQIMNISKKVLQIFEGECFPENQVCFNVFGFDLMITDDFKVKLIEVNEKIGLKGITELKGYREMYLTNIMELAVDPIFPPKNNIPKEHHYIQIT